MTMENGEPTMTDMTNYLKLFQQLQAERDAAVLLSNAAEAELESALAVVDLYGTRARDAEAEADSLRAELAIARMAAVS